MLSPVSPAVLCGQLAPLGTKGHLSGIAKTRAPDPWRVTRTGLVGDAQGDLKNHGGPEKAIHHYPFDHYAEWHQEFGGHPLLGEPGAFGENLSTTGWTEEKVHIGDVIRFGSALLQVSQGRQPCWKLNARFAREDVAYRTQMSGRTGWYYRVLKEGTADPSDRLDLVERPRPDWPLSRLTALLYRDKDRYEDLTAMAAIPELAEGWRKLAARRVETRTTESWTSRLTGQT
jgi:MOSC domain-containing protein YiiM